MRKAFLIASTLLGLVILYFGLTFVQVWKTAHDDEARKVDAIVVMGAAQFNGTPSPVLKGRLDQTLSLYREGFAPYVLVTGGKQDGDNFTEATASASYLIANGVPDDKILREVEARDSWQELESGSNILKSRDLHSVLIVTDGFHAARVKLLADHFGLEAYTSPVKDSAISDSTQLRRMFGETAAIGAARIVGYPRVLKVNKKIEQKIEEQRQKTTVPQ